DLTRDKLLVTLAHVRIEPNNHQSFAERAAVREETACERLGDDDDVGLIERIALVEKASLEERDSQGAKIIRVDDSQLRPGVAVVRRIGPTCDLDVHIGVPSVADRQQVRQAHILNAGQSSYALGDSVVTGDELPSLRIGGLR